MSVNEYLDQQQIDAAITITKNDRNNALILFADARIYFISNENRGVKIKPLRPSDLSKSFSSLSFDTGWIEPQVRTDNYTYSCLRMGKDSDSQNWELGLITPTNTISLRLSEGIDCQVKLPPAVQLVWGKQHYLWAIENKFEPNAVLYHYPLPNIYGDGNICWGTVKRTLLKKTSQIYSLFIESEFDFYSTIYSKSEMINILAPNQSSEYCRNNLLKATKLTTEKIIDVINQSNQGNRQNFISLT